MATYKVIQDIEAEDKLFGPLTLKQFIFAVITLVCLYLCFFLATKGLAFLMILFLPPAVFFGVLAVPWSKTQPTDVWLLAKIRFYFKPRKRIWDQTGIKDLVTITVPKKVEEHLTDGLSQSEVKSRLSALANTIDSRGWATKNVNINLSTQPNYFAQQMSDRLIDTSSVPQDTPITDVTMRDDMMDEQNNPTAQNLDRMLSQSEQAHREQVKSTMSGQAQSPQASQQPADYWFMHQNAAASVPQGLATAQSHVVSPGTHRDDADDVAVTDDEKALLSSIKKKRSSQKHGNSHLKNISPLSEQKKTAKKKQPAADTKPAGNATSDPAILGLANNDDLNVATISRIANKRDQEPPADEVVVKLH